MDEAYLALIGSDRVRAATRDVLQARLESAHTPQNSPVIPAAAFAVLQAAVDRLVPQAAGEEFVEIARILDTRKRNPIGDGWRFADLPPDGIALEAGLNALDATAKELFGSPFVSLKHTDQDALLQRVQAGEITWPGLNAAHWFEDLLAESVEIYVSQPQTLARIGFSGIAFSPRWAEVGMATTQSWEPKPR